MHPGAREFGGCLAAYEATRAKFGFTPTRRLGRWQVLDWDIEYVCAPAIMNFIDQLLVRRLNDFIPDERSTLDP